MGRFWEDVHHLLYAIWYFGELFFVRKVLCMQFCTLTWIFDALAFIPAWCLTWLQHRIANVFLNVLDVVKAAPQARPKTT